MSAQNEQLEAVRAKYVGKRVRLYRGLEITVERIEGCPSSLTCYHFYAKGKPPDAVGYVTTLNTVILLPDRARKATA